MSPSLIDQYEAGGAKLRQAIQNLTPEDLRAFPVPNTWSIQQIVLHLVDTDLVLADRMKRVIAEDNPPLIGFDETRFAQRLAYHDQPAADAVTLFDLNRRLFSRVLRSLPPTAFERTGVHNQRGPLTLAQILQTSIRHLDHHLKFLYDKRALLKK